MGRWAVVALLLAGCSGPVYFKAGIPQQEGDQDAYECHYQSQMLPRTPQAVSRGAYGVPLYADPSLGLFDLALQRKMLDACMRARGYTKE
jgi:hypothetical protein